MKDLIIQESVDVKIIPGKVEFEGYEILKGQILTIDSFLSQIEVTEDNIKESKKLVAKVRKSANKLDSERIRIKKEMLEPYNDFESQVKEIVSLAKNSEEKVREQIRGLEEIERESKLKEINDIWLKRSQTFEYKEFVSFEDWFNVKFLNKTYKLSQIESELEDFLLKIETDIVVIKEMDNDLAILEEYINCFDVTDSILRVKEKIEKKKETENKVEKVFKKDVRAEKALIEIDKKDLGLVVSLLDKNDVEYKLI